MHNLKTLSDLANSLVVIWFCRVDLPKPEIKDFEVLLSPEEVARAHRFQFLYDCNRYIVQHGVLRVLLAGYMGCGPGQVDIRTNANGKPYLAAQKDRGVISFNVSCSDTVAAFAFSRIGCIGVDIEKIRAMPDMLEIVEQHFTAGEKHEIFSCPESRRSELFYKHWTRKEAVLKAQGEGLLKPLDCIDVTTDPLHKSWKVKVSEGPVSAAFWVMDIEGPSGFAVAVASECLISQTSVQYFDDISFV